MVREYRKRQRAERLARGYGKPRTQAEMRMWMEGVRERFALGEQDGERHDDA